MSKKEAAYTTKLKHVNPMDLVFGVDDDPSETTSNTDTIPLSKIQARLNQPRRYFDPHKLEELSRSIKELGILEPLLVRPLEGGNYELVAGERRYRAARAAGLDEVPCLVRDMTDIAVKQVQLVENLQREDLNAYEETIGILELLGLRLKISQAEVISLLNWMEKANRKAQDSKGVVPEEVDVDLHRQIDTINEVFATVGKFSADSYRANRLPLLNLPEDLKAALESGQIEYTKARAIARVKDESVRQRLLSEAVEQNLSLSEIKQRIANLLPVETDKTDTSLRSQYKDLSKQLERSRVWSDPKKKKTLAKLLGQIQTLLSEAIDEV